MKRRKRKRSRGLGAGHSWVRPGDSGYPDRKQTYVARDRSGKTITEPAASVAAAMQRAEKVCAAGRHVEIRGEFTSDGTYWPGHRGRVFAVCENKRWSRD